MKLMDKVCSQIREELKDAENYAMCAMKYRDTHQEIASVYNRLAGEEIRHADMLHDQAARMVERESGENEKIMKAIWEHEHGWMIEMKADAQRLIDMYKA